MKNELAMKSHLLDMLKEFMLGESGKKFAPKEHMSMEVMEMKPKDEKDFGHPEPDGDEMPESEMEGEDMEDESKKKMSLKDFLRNC